MVEKQASSEIAKSRERFEKQCDVVSDFSRDQETNEYIDRGTFAAFCAWQASERDTRERCAQLVREILTKRLCTDFSWEFVNDVAERIRGKE